MAKRLLFLLVALSSYSCLTQKKGSERLIYERLQSYRTAGLDSTVLCGSFSVFENRQTNSGRKIDLNIIVIPAIHEKQSNPPIFFMEGGPGVAATGSASFYADSINLYRLDHDIVLIDARGTGGSNPLHCRQLQFKQNLEEHFQEMYPEQNVKDCYDSLSRLADLTQYTTTNMAMDIDEVRQWLGYDKINVFGVSFGGRLAQVYMNMFPNAVASSVLWSPATTWLKMPVYHAAFAQEGLNKLFGDCKTDPLCNASFPNIQSEFNELMERGKNNGFPYKLKLPDGNTREITIPWHAFHTRIRSLTYMPFGMRQVPFLIHQCYIGNWQPFIALFPKEPTFDDFIADGLYLCITCSEDVPYFTQKEADSLARNTFMGNYRVEQQVRACSHWTRGTIPDNFSEPLKSSIPTLVLSGYYDPVTPPSIAEKIMETLPAGFLVSIPEMSHTFDGLSQPECFDKMVLAFFIKPDAKPNTDCVSQMLPLEYKTKE